jgi:tetratricopeptide (TPR) repeat protein
MKTPGLPFAVCREFFCADFRENELIFSPNGGKFNGGQVVVQTESRAAMKKLLLPICVVFLSGNVFSAPAAVGRDVSEEQAEAVEVAPPYDRHSRAVEFYITGLLQQDPAARVRYMRRAVLLDPGRRLPLAVLVRTLGRVPQAAKETAAALDGLRPRFRNDLFFVHQMGLIDTLAGVPPEKIIKTVEPLLKKKPAPKELNYFHALAAFWADLRLKIPGAAVTPPFAPDDLRLQEITILYYGTSGLRDRLFARESVAPAGIADCVRRLCSTSFSRLAEVRGALAVLSAVRRFDEAYEIAEKWRKTHQDPVSELLFIETASRAGRRAELEAALKKHPSLSVDFCAKMRFACFLARNDFVRAEQELANFKSPAEKLTRGLTLTQVTRNAEKMRACIARMRFVMSRDSAVVAMAYLSFAELHGDKAAFRAGEALISGARAAQDPVLANAAGYVATVLGLDLDRAEERIKFALSREPESPAYLDSMAWLKYKRGDYAQAAEYMDKAISRVTVSIGGAVIAEHAGDIDLALGSRKRALARFKTALELYEKNKVENADLDPEPLRKKIAGLEKSFR